MELFRLPTADVARMCVQPCVFKACILALKLICVGGRVCSLPCRAMRTTSTPLILPIFNGEWTGRAPPQVLVEDQTSLRDGRDVRQPLGRHQLVDPSLLHSEPQRGLLGSEQLRHRDTHGARPTLSTSRAASFRAKSLDRRLDVVAWPRGSARRPEPSNEPWRTVAVRWRTVAESRSERHSYAGFSVPCFPRYGCSVPGSGMHES